MPPKTKRTTFSETLGRIQLAQPGTRVDPVNLVRQNPTMAALISKLVVDPTMQSTRNSQAKINAAMVHKQAVQEPSRDLARQILETETVMQMHPDLEIASQILISCVLAPEDLTTVEVIYSVRDNDFPSDLNNSLVEEVRRYMEETHNIKAELPKILRSVLITAGSYPIAVIPENSLDDLINHRVGAESHGSAATLFDTSGKGILGPVNVKMPTPLGKDLAAGLEDLFSFKPREAMTASYSNSMKRGDVDFGVSVIDNPALLYVPKLAETMRGRTIRSLFGAGLEDFGRVTSASPEGEDRYAKITRERTFKNRPSDHAEIRPVLQKELASRQAVGCPLLIRLSPTAAIPVYVPGYPEKHIGYFVPLDAEGNPLDITDPTTLQQDLSFRFAGGGASGLSTYLMSEVKNQVNGWDISNRAHVDHAAKIYAAMVEDDLVARLRNGLYGRSYTIGNNSEVYRLMLSRSLKNDHTTLLYVPVELMSYFAIRYNKNGTGKSLMQDAHVVNAMRSIVTMANLFRSIRNSVSRTKVDVTLDEDIEDPQGALELIKGELIRSRSSLPIYTSDPTEITNWLSAAGYEFAVEGNPDLPNTKIEFSEAASSQSMPDENLDTMLRNKSLGVLGINPEMIDSARSNVEFAAQVWNNNALLNKRVIQIQDEFKPEFENHVRRLIINSETALTRMRSIVEEHFTRIAKSESVKTVFPGELTAGETKREVVNWVVEKFIDLMDVGLPRPNSATIESMAEHMKNYTDALDSKLDAIINTEFMNTEGAGEISGKTDTIKAMAKAHFLRKEMARIGFLPEVDDLVLQNDQGQPVLNLYEAVAEHNKGLIRGFNKIASLIKPVIDASDTNLQNNGDETSGVDGGSSDSGSDDGSGSDESGGEDDLFGGGGDDLFGGDGGLDDTSSDDSASAGAGSSEDSSSSEPAKDADAKPEEDDSTTDEKKPEDNPEETDQNA